MADRKSDELREKLREKYPPEGFTRVSENKTLPNGLADSLTPYGDNNHEPDAETGINHGIEPTEDESELDFS